MPEWLNGAVSKTVIYASISRVQIPLFPPPLYFSLYYSIELFRYKFETNNNNITSILKRFYELVLLFIFLNYKFYKRTI